jgi:hemolysin III
LKPSTEPQNPAGGLRPVTGRTLGEDIAVSVVDGLGAVLGVAALALLVIRASRLGSVLADVSYSVYASSLVFYFGASCLFHALSGENAKRVFRVFSHAGAYFVIAGTTTPVMLISVRGAWGWALAGVSWAVAILGIVFSSLFLGKLRGLFLGLYFLIACLLVVAIKPLVTSIERQVLAWLVSGIVAFLVSGVFRRVKSVPSAYVAAHCFALAGSVLQFFGMLKLT